MASNITTLKPRDKGITWINIVNAQKAEISYLRRKFKFNEMDLKDSFSNQYAQRPKFYQRNGYCFLILQFPIYNQKTRTIEPEEIDFFISKDSIVVLHKNNLNSLIELTNLCSTDDFYCRQYLTSNVAFLYEVIVRLQEYCYGLLDRISLDVKSIEQNIFAGHERRMVTDILYTKRNILNFRKIMEAHKAVIQKIMRARIKYLPIEKQEMYYHNLIEHTKDIWGILENQKETIEALEDTNASLLTFKLNDIMRILTIFSVIVMPLTLLASIFGMNTENGMPFMAIPYGFWFIICLMLTLGLIMYWLFKKKKWL